MANVVTHCSHSLHKLVKTTDDVCTYTCDLCGSDGSGIHFRCEDCDFDLHESCAKLPETMSFFAHPWHDVHLMKGRKDCICDLCYEPVNHDFYYYCCMSCGFEAHPHCTKLKQVVQSKLHPQHDLYLLPDVPSCNACKKFRGIWMYRCGICEVSFHINCLNDSIMPKEISHSEKNNDGSRGISTSSCEVSIDSNTRSLKKNRVKDFLLFFAGEANHIVLDMISDQLKSLIFSGNEDEEDEDEEAS